MREIYNIRLYVTLCRTHRENDPTMKRLTGHYDGWLVDLALEKKRPNEWTEQDRSPCL